MRAPMASREHVRKVPAGRHEIWKKKKPLLRWLDAELTERCNLNCIHCCINRPANDAETMAREIDTSGWQEVLQEAAALGCLTVRFTGGEPLLREDFGELYLRARQLGLKVVLFTNATLITPELAGVLARIPPLARIEVSVYGMKRSSYEAVTRTPGSFAASHRGLRLLKENKIPFAIKSALLPANRDEREDFTAWAGSLAGMDGPPQQAMLFDLRCRRDLEDKNRIIRRSRPSPGEALKVFTTRKEEYIKEMKLLSTSLLAPRGGKLFTCGAGKGTACVDAYGGLQPCLLLRHPDAVYDLGKGSLRDALQNFFPDLRRRKARNDDYMRRCAACFLRWLCEQCPGKSWGEHGTMDTPVDYLCEIAQAQARHLGLLGRGEKPWLVKDWRGRISDFTESLTNNRKSHKIRFAWSKQ